MIDGREREMRDGRQMRDSRGEGGIERDERREGKRNYKLAPSHALTQLRPRTPRCPSPSHLGGIVVDEADNLLGHRLADVAAEPCDLYQSLRLLLLQRASA